MATNVRVIPTQRNRIRAFAQAHPGLSPREIEAAIGHDRQVVQIALLKGDKRRSKSVAK